MTTTVTILDTHGNQTRAHVHYAGVTQDGRQALTIDGQLYVVEVVS